LFKLPFDIDDHHAPLLMPSFVLSETVTDPPTYDKMSAEELDAYLTEMEPEIRTADRDTLEVEALEKRGVTGAGRLPGIQNLIIYCGRTSS
jgi:Cu+-exporting ATPase